MCPWHGRALLSRSARTGPPTARAWREFAGELLRKMEKGARQRGNGMRAVKRPRHCLKQCLCL